MAHLLKVGEAAARLSVSPSMVRKLQDQGLLTKARIGRAVRVPDSEVEALIVKALQGTKTEGRR